MAIPRERFTFPTRHYPYSRLGQVSAGAAADAGESLELLSSLQTGQLYANVIGLDLQPRLMPGEEIETGLRDPFANLLLKRGVFPLTLRQLLAALDAVNDDPQGQPDQRVFLAAEGGQIPWSAETANLNRALRLAIVRSRGSDARLMVSASTALDSEHQFLQLIGWDESNGVYHFYERRAGTWLWAGSTLHSLQPQTRGQGPFDSHVNGTLVMKELRVPWNNWHSMSAGIQDVILDPGDPFRHESLFLNRVSAHELETRVVRPGVVRSVEARWKRARSADGGALADVHQFMRQVLETTTVNLVSSLQQSAQIADEDMLRLPVTFFLNTAALLDTVKLDPDIANIAVSGRFYRESLTKYDFALTSSRFRQPGDTFFAFLVPEPSLEDNSVLDLLARQGVISSRFAACLLMIDFPNPVFSARRAKLMAYVPASARLSQSPGGASSDLEQSFVAAVEAVESSLAADSPEAEFLANWRLPEDQWQATFERRIGEYFAKLVELARTEEGFDGWVRLAESRRRAFRRRPLAEFPLTVPTTNIPLDAPALMMRDDGTVHIAPEQE